MQNLRYDVRCDWMVGMGEEAAFAGWRVWLVNGAGEWRSSDQTDDDGTGGSWRGRDWKLVLPCL